MAIPATYSARRAVALPGQISDTSLYNVDGACAASGDIVVGRAVRVTSAQPVDGHKVVAAPGADGAVYGVAVISHAYAPEGKYDDGSAINVLTHGRVWVECMDSTAPTTFGAAINFNADGRAQAAGAINSGWTFAGGFTKVGGVNIIEVQLTQSAPVPAAAGAGA